MTHVEPVPVKVNRKREAETGGRPKGRRAIVLTTLLTLGTIAWLLPVIGLLITAFRSRQAATTSGWWTVFVEPMGQGWTAENFAAMFSQNNFGVAFVNSFAVAIPSTVLPISFAAFAAYALTFLEWRGRDLIFGIIVGLMIVPIQVALIPILKAYVDVQKAWGIQIVGSFPAAWIVHAAFAMPLAIFIFRNYMATLPVSLIDAARVDGASHFQIFWRLVMPMSIPALASFAIFQFLWVWNDYLVAFIFLGNKNPVVTQALLSMLGQYAQGWQLVAAGSLVTLIVPLVVFFGLQRFFVRGLTAGSVK